MLRRQSAVKRAGGRKAIQTRGSFGPNHAVLEPSEMGRFREIGNRAHTWTVGTQRQDAATAEIVHRIWMRVRPARCFAFNRLCDKPPSGWKWPKILVTITAPEQYDVAESEWPVFLFPIQYVVFVDETAFAVRSFVDEGSDVDDTGFTDELPGGHLFAKDQA